MLDVRYSHLYFYQSLNRMQRGLSAIAELLVLVSFDGILYNFVLCYLILCKIFCYLILRSHCYHSVSVCYVCFVAWLVLSAAVFTALLLYCSLTNKDDDDDDDEPICCLWVYYFIALLASGEVKPSVSAFDAIVSGPLSQFLSCSSKLAGDVQAQVCLCPKCHTFCQK